MVRLGELHTIPCDILNWGLEFGSICVALLLITPWAWLDGELIVVLARTLEGNKHNKITAQT